MNIIQKLSLQEAQKIAAGEVVERPANILKELIENSLDAGSTRITIKLSDGGKTLLQVIDNGYGMSKEDALMCIERYATSKITKLDDLETLTTYGFRGEALASICAVAHVDLITKQQDALQGTAISCIDGAIKTVKNVGCSVGTSITIYNLFESLPARKKFLKTTATEWNQCVQLFKAYAAQKVTVSWTLEHDEIILYNCPAVSSLLDRASQLFDTNLTRHSVLLETTKIDGVIIEGWITTSSYGRYDRNALYFFVNGRWVKNYQLAAALLKGYGNTLPKGRYPAAVILLTLDQQEVDINVHPKKEEVLFLHPKRVMNLITQTVQKTFSLDLSEKIIPTTSVDFSNKNYNYSELDNQTYQAPMHDYATRQYNENIVWQHLLNNVSDVKQEIKEHVESKQEIAQEFLEKNNYLNLIGQFNKTYLLLEDKNGLLMIDQHAAHERILYERFLNNFNDVSCVTLLFPEVISLQSDELSLLVPWFVLLKEQGIEVEQFSASSVVVRTMPVFFKNQSMQELLLEIIVWLKEFSTLQQEEVFKRLTQKIRAQMACKAAVKAGDLLSREQQEQLLSDLTITHNNTTCPHGRPTSWLVPLYDIEKKFKRKN